MESKIQFGGEDYGAQEYRSTKCQMVKPVGGPRVRRWRSMSAGQILVAPERHLNPITPSLLAGPSAPGRPSNSGLDGITSGLLTPADGIAKADSASPAGSDSHPGLLTSVVQALQRVGTSRRQSLASRTPTPHDLEHTPIGGQTNVSPAELNSSVPLEGDRAHSPVRPFKSSGQMPSSGRILPIPIVANHRRVLPVTNRLLPSTIPESQFEWNSEQEVREAWRPSSPEHKRPVGYSIDRLGKTERDWSPSGRNMATDEMPPRLPDQPYHERLKTAVSAELPRHNGPISHPVPPPYSSSDTLRQVFARRSEPSLEESANSDDGLSLYTRGDTPSPAPSIGAAILRPDVYPGSEDNVPARRRPKLDVSDYAVYSSIPRNYALVQPSEKGTLPDYPKPIWTASLPDTPVQRRQNYPPARKKYRRHLPAIPVQTNSKEENIPNGSERPGSPGAWTITASCRPPGATLSEVIGRKLWPAGHPSSEELRSRYSSAGNLFASQNNVYEPPVIDPHGPAPSIPPMWDIYTGNNESRTPVEDRNPQIPYPNGIRFPQYDSLLPSQLQKPEKNWRDQVGFTSSKLYNNVGQHFQPTGSYGYLGWNDQPNSTQWARVQPCEVPLPRASSPPPPPAPQPVVSGRIVAPEVYGQNNLLGPTYPRGRTRTDYMYEPANGVGPNPIGVQYPVVQGHSAAPVPLPLRITEFPSGQFPQYPDGIDQPQQLYVRPHVNQRV
ncbi:unnamed protein product [Calicophoron daubneyi]|uniref:Uncharacterized protein n=1 Tax=Calicophoron daubneyi TaxID=300641 RepID=A0AAV2TBX0_CALDB